MLKSEIINDIKFRKQCGQYGLDWEKCEIVDEVILLSTPIKDLYVIFDNNYNTIAIERIDSNHSMESIKEFVRKKYFEYCNFRDILLFGVEVGYPFEKFTLKQIIDIATKIEMLESNHGHSIRTRVNGEFCDQDSQNGEIYLKLFSYLKFLGEEIKQYFLLSYHMQAMQFTIPDIYSYIINLISRINECIDFHLKQNSRLMPADMLNFIGQNHRDTNMYGILYAVIDLLMNKRGYKVKSGFSDEIEPCEKLNVNLSSLVAELITLALSDEDLEKKEETPEGNVQKSGGSLALKK